MFYHFLHNLFHVTMEIDGSINRLNTYTVLLHYNLECRKKGKEVILTDQKK